MTPCPSCLQQDNCTEVGRCKEIAVARAIGELKEATTAYAAATARLQEAIAGMGAVLAILKSRER